MEAQIQSLAVQALAEIAACADESQLEALRVRLLGKGGELTAFSDRMRELSKEDKPRIGKVLNETRASVNAALEARNAAMTAAQETRAFEGVDVSLPSTGFSQGALHPITQLMDRAVQIFRRMGFALADGPDIETEWHCFDALNTPADHPAVFCARTLQVFRFVLWNTWRRPCESSLRERHTGGMKWMPRIWLSSHKWKGFMSMKM